MTFRWIQDGCPSDLTFDGTPYSLNGKQLKLGAVLDPLIKSHLEQEFEKNPRYKLSGHHAGHAKFQSFIPQGTLFVKEAEVASVSASFGYSVEVQYPVLTGKFSIQGKGGFFKLEYPPGTMGRETVALEIITKHIDEQLPS